MIGKRTDEVVVGADPAFLEGDYVGWRTVVRDSLSYGEQTGAAVGRDVFEAPTIEGENVQFWYKLTWGGGGGHLDVV